MKYNPITRRHFLQGVGGSLMTLPLLPSLMPRAHAQGLPSPKFLVMIGSGHGGVGNDKDWFPAPIVDSPLSTLLTTRNLFSNQPTTEIPHQYRYGLLRNMLSTDTGHPGGNVDNAAARTSFVLGQFFNPVIDKMNLYRGIDIGTFYSGHHRGVYGGNIQEAVNNPDAAAKMQAWATIDQFLANSPKFYRSDEDISTKVINLRGGISRQEDGSRPPAISDRIDRIYTAIFSKYENNQSPAVVAERARKQLLIDRVHEEYKRLTQGAFGPARKISSEDKLRIEQHADFLTDLQKKYQNIINSCTDVTGPREAISFSVSRTTEGMTNLARVYDLATDLMVAAFQCGASRLGVIQAGNPSLVSDYHGEVAHQLSDPRAKLLSAQSFRWTSEHIIAPLVLKMNQAMATNGKSVLDNGLVLWTHECGVRGTHSHDSVGLVSFGSLDGFFQTGRYLDYRNLENFGILVWNESEARPGIPIQRFWANIVRGMGYLPRDYERFGRPGYGDSTINDYPRGDSKLNKRHIAYPPTIMNSLSDLIPGLAIA